MFYLQTVLTVILITSSRSCSVVEERALRAAVSSPVALLNIPRLLTKNLLASFEVTERIILITGTSSDRSSCCKHALAFHIIVSSRLTATRLLANPSCIFFNNTKQKRAAQNKRLSRLDDSTCAQQNVHAHIYITFINILTVSRKGVSVGPGNKHKRRQCVACQYWFKQIDALTYLKTPKKAL
jgi:uncharacterized membrane protein